MMCLFFFFFKQKTAYEMRISDWSSDVCSSDLFYSELVWDTRKVRARADGGSVDWVILRNRLAHLEARNMRRVGDALGELAKRVGFRVIPGLSERVIYRELFPRGLTLLRSEERRVGEACGSTCRSRWSLVH